MSEETVYSKFERIYNDYFADVHNFLIYLAKDTSEADDLCQETFLRFLKKYGRREVTDVVNCKFLLLKVAKNLFLNSQRHKKKFVQLSDRSFENIRDNSADFIAVHEWQAYVKETTQMLRMVNEMYAVIFTLRIVNGYDYKNIARICGKTTRTIRRHMQAIRGLVTKFE